MSINKTLADIRYAVGFIIDSGDYAGDPFIVELANNFLALDDAIRAGGTPPDSWKTPDRVPPADPGDAPLCCESTYICPQSGERECVTHGGFDTCCDDPTCPSKAAVTATIPGRTAPLCTCAERSAEDWTGNHEVECPYRIWMETQKSPFGRRAPVRQITDADVQVLKGKTIPAARPLPYPPLPSDIKAKAQEATAKYLRFARSRRAAEQDGLSTNPEIVPWPEGVPPRYNGQSEACDAWRGPCCCGAWHLE